MQDADGNTYDEIERVVRLEVELLDPAVRTDPARLDTLLHPDFIEHGASGRIWTRQAIIDELSLESSDAPRTTASELLGRFVADGVILVTYRTASDVKTAVRSSIWVRSPSDQWQIRFHQGTPLPQLHR